jgi:hypothetical protein
MGGDCGAQATIVCLHNARFDHSQPVRELRETLLIQVDATIIAQIAPRIFSQPKLILRHDVETSM